MNPPSFDLDTIIENLRAGSLSESTLRAWLESTYDLSNSFHQASFDHASKIRNGLLKSRYGEAYELYHDLVVAHIGRGRTAIIARAGKEWLTLSYEQLHERCSALASWWRGQGIGAGAHVCLLQSPGIDYAVALLTSLRMGLVVSAVPPVGRRLVQQYLDALAPAYVIASERERRLLGSYASKAIGLEATSGEKGSQLSHCYSPDEPVLRLLSPFGCSLEVGESSAAAVHASLLRDSLFVYGLNDSEVVAAPGFDTLQFQPMLMLAVLSAGATWVELNIKDIEADPGLIRGLGITLLGISHRFRDTVLGGDDSVMPKRAWFRSLTDVLDYEKWVELGRRAIDNKIPGFGIVANAASGGVSIFAPARLEASPLTVWPVPGKAWQLSEIAGGTVLALNDAGVYSALSEDGIDDIHPKVVLARQKEHYVYAGGIELGPNAQRYPTECVIAAVEEHAAVRHADIVIMPGRWPNEARVVLLVFTESSRVSDAQPQVDRSALRTIIANEIGDQWLPDRIEVFPLRPRLVGGSVDRAWCRSQYLSGALTTKSRSELFVTLSQLGYILADRPGIT